MTATVADPPRTASHPTPRLKTVAGISLVLAGLTNGLPQYLVELVTGGHADFGDQIRWSVDHRGVHVAEQLTILLSSLLMPIGLLGLAWVAHHTVRRLTAVATVLVVWGMWGFHNVLAMGYVSGTVAPEVVGVDAAVRLNDGLVEDPGVLVTALLPHLLGSFLGLLLLAAACWRSGAFPRTPLVLMVAFLVWDFALPADPPFEPHLLLVVAWCWLGMHLVRMPSAVWRGREAPHGGTTTTY